MPPPPVPPKPPPAGPPPLSDRSTAGPGAAPYPLVVDASLAVGLVAVLGLILLVDRGCTRWRAGAGSPGSGGPAVEVVEEPTGPVLPVGPPRLAVTPPAFDDMGGLLSTLGEGYRYDDLAMEDLLDPKRLAEYDVVFVTCGYVPKEWVAERMRDDERSGGGHYAVRPETAEQLRSSLRGFVAAGGTLYVSDRFFQLLVIAYPKMIDSDNVADGDEGTVEAEVVDPGLRKRLGPTVQLEFDKRAWCPAALRGPDVTTYLRGTYRTVEGDERNGPLLVRFPFERGHVIFTSFHNEKQNSETERELLRYLVFTTVTAETDARVRRTLVRSGFSPVDRSLFSASPENPSLTQVYECEGGQTLQFVLGFEGRGAELELTVEGPDGSRFQESGTTTFRIEVPDVAKGEWRYTVRPVEVPYENFPFTLTIGEKRR
jgi:hypothetical protein